MSNKKKVLLITFLILVMFLLVFIYFVFIREEKLLTVPGERRISGIKTEFDSDFLQSSNFKKLKQHGRLPVEVGIKGQVNPFQIPESESPIE